MALRAHWQRGAQRGDVGAKPVLHALIGGVGIKPMGPGALTPQASSRGGQAGRERPFGATIGTHKEGGLGKLLVAVLCAGEEARDGAAENGPARTLSAQAFTDRGEVLALNVALGMAPPTW
ncbi:hypothetical protein B0H14DRAFT_2604303 [Mycena olivaceomarginata]|nr:hypothetical protein B0H14DRAFT_2604303 [Mycena olivaceomarginata]